MSSQFGFLEGVHRAALAGLRDGPASPTRQTVRPGRPQAIALQLVGNHAAVWVLSQRSTEEYVNNWIFLYREEPGVWKLPDLASAGHWPEEGWTRADEEWAGWGPVVDLSTHRWAPGTGGTSGEVSFQAPETGWIYATGIASRRLIGVTATSRLDERQATVDTDSGVFLVMVKAEWREDISIVGWEYGGRPVPLLG